VFKSQCPDAYSWQFDDLASKNDHFQVDLFYFFCICKVLINVQKLITK
jgi:hypothetical protein